MNSDEPLPDDRYMEGVYYHGGAGECYKFERDEENHEVIMREPVSEEQEKLSFEEFVYNVQDDLFPVPEKALNRPVEYYNDVVNIVMGKDPHFDVGYLYADKVTRTVHVNDIEEEQK